MNWLDVVLLVILAISVAASFRAGFTREIVGLATLIAAILAAVWFYGMAGGWLRPYVSSPAIANFCGFFIAFAAVMAAGALAGMVLARVMKFAGLSFFDRLLGAGFGVVKGVLLGIAVILAIMAFSPGAEPPPAVVRSRCAPYVIEASRAVAAMAPHELKDGFHKKYDQVKNLWQDALKRGVRQEKAQDERPI